MKCINCGAGIEGTTLGALVKCDFCGTTNALIQSIESAANVDTEMSPQDLSIFKEALRELDSGEYADALDLLEDIKGRNRENWRIHINIAIASFWLGYDDFRHLPLVIKHVRRAMSCAPDPTAIKPYVMAIVYNIAKVSSLDNRFGQSLLNCVDAIETTKELVADYPERDELIKQIVTINAQSLKRDFWIVIKRDGKKYDPPSTLVQTLVKLAALDPAADPETTALAIVSFERKGQIDGISGAAVDSLKKALQRVRGGQGSPELKFPIFGGPKLEF